METVTNLFGGTIGLILLITIVVLPIIIFIVLIRWLFRINEIAGYLERIANRLDPDIPDLTEVKTSLKQGRCGYCHKYFTPEKLTITSSNTIACPTCAKLL